MRTKNARAGFTIVELLLVVIVIAVLAAITIAAFSGIQLRAVEAALKTDLANAARQMDIAKVLATTYPSQIPLAGAPSSNVGLSLSVTGDSNRFCMNGTVKSQPGIAYKYENGAVSNGLCSGPIIPGSEMGSLENIITDPTFSDLSTSTGWHLNIEHQAGVTLTTRPGTASDPIPSSPVLIITNASPSASTYGMIQSNAIDLPKIKIGKSYYRSFYARKTNALYTGEILVFQVSDPSWNNAAIPQAYDHPTTTAWQKYSATATAVRDGGGMNLLYLPISSDQFNTAGWSLEFQGFNLYEQ